MRTLAELTATDEPAWPLLQQWTTDAVNLARLLPVDRAQGDRVLEQLQVTLRSPMGALVYHSGGLLIDDGWLRVLGSGSTELPRSLPAWNEGKTETPPGAPPPFLLVADDVLGGLFAINGGGLPSAPGHMCYFAPDTLGWQDLGRGYTDFLDWALHGDLAGFYEGMRWPGWRDDVAALGADRTFSFYPFLWAEGEAIAQRSRRAVPIAELFALQQDVARQLRG